MAVGCGPTAPGGPFARAAGGAPRAGPGAPGEATIVGNDPRSPGVAIAGVARRPLVLVELSRTRSPNKAKPHGHEGSPEVADCRDRRAPRASIAARPRFRTKRGLRIVAIAGPPGVKLEAGPRCRTKRSQFAAPAEPGRSHQSNPTSSIPKSRRRPGPAAEQSGACGLSRLQGAPGTRSRQGPAAEQSEPNSPRLPNQADRTNRTQRSRSRCEPTNRPILPQRRSGQALLSPRRGRQSIAQGVSLVIDKSIEFIYFSPEGTTEVICRPGFLSPLRGSVEVVSSCSQVPGLTPSLFHTSLRSSRTRRRNDRIDKRRDPGESVKRGVEQCWLHGWWMR
jgi:hypothetical protein